ncbi:glycosyltransferase [Cytophagaceae bacterium DM2B3-1]|uniref:Glycosyltransferase n=1 Tax=Xanthocytophaga flava TaxID=3048013 RepID=A0ABT7CL39_9BACT|nr:glycosyltransferase [Xanthocytophaga flavus]MDJ1494256.1 glycosyltransferase [Xanthocytophaga flavus]
MNKKILFLPDAGPNNPFQYQLIDFLKKHDLQVAKAPSGRFLATWKAIRTHKPDVVYYDWIQSFILGKTLLITLLKCFLFWFEIQYLIHIRKTPILHTLHNMRNHAGRWTKIEHVIYRYFLRRCSRIRVYSDSTRLKASRFFKIPLDKIYVIQDVPYHHYYPNTVTQKEGRTNLNFSDTAFIYLFLGMVKPYKGLEELIKAFKELEGDDNYLVIAGKGDSALYEKSIEQQIDNHPRIVFHNAFIAIDQVQYYMNAANVVVLPFKNIEHSGSVDLALSFGKPVITKETIFLQKLLHHQQELFFRKGGKSLLKTLQKAQQIDIAKVGEKNYQVAEQSNYKDLLKFFRV